MTRRSSDAPHRAGRAQLTHPVPQGYGFAPEAIYHRLFNNTNLGSGPRCVSGDKSEVPTSSFANHGLLWVSYPAFNRYYEDAKNASARLSRLRLALGVRYPGCFLFLGSRKRKARWRPWTFLSRYGPSPALFRGDRRLSQLPWSPTPSLCPVLRPRADLHARPFRRFGVAPASPTTKAPPIISISRLNHTASRPAAYA